MSDSPIIKPDHAFFDLTREMKNISDPLLKHLKISYFSFKRTFSDGSKIYLFNNPNYFEHYFNKKFYLLGNKEGSINNYESSYDLWDYLPDPHAIYQDCLYNFGITHGLVITQKHKDYCDFFFFAADKRNVAVKQLYLNKKELFYHFCEHFLKNGRKIIAEASNKKIILPSVSPLVYGTKSDNADIEEFLEDVRQDVVAKINLTTRELNCAHLLIQGKSNKEIARVLEISPRTVEDHIKNIRQKTNCKNRVELVSLLCKPSSDMFDKISD